jgi:predicted O-methyltransferase YrrM
MKALAKTMRKVVAAGEHRRSRLHDELGELVSLSRLLRNGPRALATGLGRRLLGYRSVRPWNSYDAQQVFAKHLGPTSRVLEFGSGMSTVWYARRAGEVVSIEDWEPWYRKVGDLLAREGLSNVRYRFASNPDEYVRPTREEAGEGFDFIMVDGSLRDRCVENTLGLLRPGGIIYLDNADKGVDIGTGDIPRARQLLIDFATARGADVRSFTDFAPTQLFAEQGLLVRLPSRP